MLTFGKSYPLFKKGVKGKGGNYEIICYHKIAKHTHTLENIIRIFHTTSMFETHTIYVFRWYELECTNFCNQKLSLAQSRFNLCYAGY